MDNVKVSVTIALPGRVLVPEQPCSKNGKEKKRKNEGKEKNPQTMDELYERQFISMERGKDIVINVRKGKPAKQSLKITQEAYDNMVSSPLTGYSDNYWKSLTSNKRVKLHLIEIAKSLGGVLESFEVIND